MRAIASAFAMTDEVWARHANPWSVWTRVPILPLLCLGLWARAWIGWWCILPVALLVAWTWANPRVFPPPATTRSWASRAVLGERAWLARGDTPIPSHHAVWAGLLSALPALGLLPLAWGLWALDACALALGLVIMTGAKMWFLDRMVWLYQDMASAHPHYSEWRR